MVEKNTPELLQLTTEHYTFTAKRTIRADSNGTPILYYYEVGESTNPCLSLFIYLQTYTSINPYYDISTVKLGNIKALDSCNENEVSENTYIDHSFGTELLNEILKHIQTTYPYIRYISLNDTSYIPCNRKLNDELDLLTYSIALYGKTWYERRFNAYLKNKNAQQRYVDTIKNYSSPEFKQTFDFNTFLNTHLMNTSEYTYEFVKKNYSMLEDIFNSSNTFPDFFLGIQKYIPRDKKCVFYKFWLEEFITKYVKYEREWTFTLTPSVGGRRDTNYRNTKRRRHRKKYKRVLSNA
jgi:hypothetical protein